ncbi:hypothetical protein M5K25_022121 [Dendrobium thyrsiflorum]|uniref:Uncharacterized protein n=1 Tax=Dendrobium thyrsiflorum TaxID=117978 RepID=A0ABD0UBF8_DENTH
MGLTSDGIPQRSLHGVDRRDGRRHGSCFGPNSNFALTSKFSFLSVGTFRRRIPEPVVEVSRPDVHHAGHAVIYFFVRLSNQTIASPMEGDRDFKLLVPERFFQLPSRAISLDPSQAREPILGGNGNFRLLGLQMRTSRSSGRIESPWRPFSIHAVHRNDDSYCSRSEKLKPTKMDGGFGISSLNDSICQLDPGSSSQLDPGPGLLVAFRWSFNGLIKANGGGIDDGPDQDHMVLSSRVIVVPGFDALGEHTGAGHNRNIVVPFGGRITQLRGP